MEWNVPITKDAVCLNITLNLKDVMTPSSERQKRAEEYKNTLDRIKELDEAIAAIKEKHEREHLKSETGKSD